MKMRIPSLMKKTFGAKLAVGIVSMFLSIQCVAASYLSEWHKTISLMLEWNPQRKPTESEFVMKSISSSGSSAQIDLRLKKELVTQFFKNGLKDNFLNMSLFMGYAEDRSYIYVRNLKVVWNFKVQNDPGLMDIRTTNMLVLDKPEDHSNRQAIADRICQLVGGQKALEIYRGLGSSTPIDVLDRYGFQDREANVSDVANNAVLVFSNPNISNPELEEIGVTNLKYPEGNLFSLRDIDCKKLSY